MPVTPFRIGFGYDVHQLAHGHKLILGGVEIPHEKGSIAHSDGDVLIHAICDALLGAAALRDIGIHFPDNSETYKDISSLILLQKTISLLDENGYAVVNIDSTICLQRPKIKDYIPEMIVRLAGIMNTDPVFISVKATTTEKLGFVGEELGISAYAVAMIEKRV
ncbi:MAG TPA: 2-C-methyl-D-erythritol 2,4-cyclodiphosphate synthase [Bacteroidales bacterium]|jgi:2-C-methyl-D-erythritol 2,4-cyclodiphosphate synthase|nr:2-C-methyl-D-erythritol 2,4-cyclodiphosphate synthase [Bacteroidales bacterium]